MHPRFARRRQPLSRLTDILSWVLLSIVLLSVATGQLLPSSAPLFAAQPSQTDPQEPDTPCTGWVYVGPAHDDSQWAFSVEQSTSHSSSAMQEHAARAGEQQERLTNAWIRAKQPTLLREDHYNDLTGTWLGNLFGVEEPDVIAVIGEDTRTHVQDEVRVGLDIFGHGVIWAEVPCPSKDDNLRQ